MSTTMASTPSASALSAVLRCRGNIWARNPPTKRPATSAYSLGLAGGAPAERTGSQQPSAWEVFPGERVVVVGRGPGVLYGSDRSGGTPQRERGSRDRSYYPKVSLGARRRTCDLPGRAHCSRIILRITHQTAAAHIWKVVLVQDIGGPAAGMLRLSVPFPGWGEDAGQVPCLVLTGWSTLRGTYLSLTALVSNIIFTKLAGWCRSCRSSSSPNGPHQPSQQGEEDIRSDALQAHGQIHMSSEDTSGSGQKITQDRPD